MTLHQQEVDVVLAHRVVQQVPARSDPELKRGGVWQARQLVHRHYAAECAAPRVERVVIPEHPAPHERARAVGADDEVGLGAAAVVEAQGGARAGVVDPDQPPAQLNVIESDGRGQDRLQVGAMNADVGRPEPLAVSRPGAMLADQAAGRSSR